MSYQKLFEKGQIGGLELKNRIVMSPMGCNLGETQGGANERIIRYYEERARGGVGLILTEFTRIDEITGIGSLHQLSCSAPNKIRNLVELTERVHRHGAKIFTQLHHSGRQINSSAMGGNQPVAPSPIPCQVTQEMPRELTTAECAELTRKFVAGAVISKMAGFDGVELHGAHGYLINQFLSPHTNRRTDKYGGDFIKRLNFILEIIIGIKTMCGPNFPISVRLSADEFVEGGLKLEDTVKIARFLEGKGVHAINVSSGTYESGGTVVETLYMKEGWKKHLATEMKKNLKIPVIAVNTIKYPATAEQFLEEGVCDFIGLGRALLADPCWPKKAQSGDTSRLRVCLGCMQCFKQIGEGRPIECTINPALGRERIYNEHNLRKDGNGQPVAVIGGGPAGMQAAYILARRGFKTTLFEKSGELGGTVNLAAKPACKDRMNDLIRTQEADMKAAGVEVRLNTPATVAALKELKPCAVFLATGGTPILPSLPGVDKAHVCTAEDYLAGKVEIKGKKVVVIGGGVTGLETAEMLSHDNEVTLTEMLGDVGTTLYKTVKLSLVKMLTERGVQIITGHAATAIGDGEVTLNQALTMYEKKVPADAVVLAIGVNSDRSLLGELEAAFDNVLAIGDADSPGQIVDAIRDGNGKAYVFEA